MKKLFLLPALLTISILSAQTTMVTWQDISTTGSGGAPPLDGGVAITTDGSGNSFTVGNFSNSMTIGSDNLTSSGSRDIYVAKYNTSGTCVKAVRLGSASDDEGYSIAWKTDGTNAYVYVTGYEAGQGVMYKLDDDASPLTLITTRYIDYDVHPRSIYSYGTNRLMIG